MFAPAAAAALEAELDRLAERLTAVGFEARTAVCADSAYLTWSWADGLAYGKVRIAGHGACNPASREATWERVIDSGRLPVGWADDLWADLLAAARTMIEAEAEAADPYFAEEVAAGLAALEALTVTA